MYWRKGQAGHRLHRLRAHELIDADGDFTGFDTELATAVCEKVGVEPEFVEINWDTRVVELDAKEYRLHLERHDP